MPDIERREWLDEFEEQGWTKRIGEDGSIQYERPCRDGRPVPLVSLPKPPPGLLERLRRWWGR